ncbi:MAG: hypothetical protein ACX94A_05595 [Algiphilus sp.]
MDRAERIDFDEDAMKAAWPLVAACLALAACANTGGTSTAPRSNTETQKVTFVEPPPPRGLMCDDQALESELKAALASLEAQPSSSMLAERIRAQAIIFWAYDGPVRMSGRVRNDSVLPGALISLAECFEEGACGLKASMDKATALRATAAEGYSGRLKFLPKGLLADVPPASAMAWARTRTGWTNADCNFAFAGNTLSAPLRQLRRVEIASTRNYAEPLRTPARPSPLKTGINQCPIGGDKFDSDMAIDYESAILAETLEVAGARIAKSKSNVILKWAIDGRGALAADPKSLFFLGYCYYDGDCGLAKDEFRGRALLAAAQAGAVRDEALIGPRVLPGRAYKWLKEKELRCRGFPNFLPHNMTLAEHWGQIRERQQREAEFRLARARADRFTSEAIHADLSTDIGKEAHLQRAMNAQADAGNVEIFVENAAFATLSTAEQKGRAIANQMRYWEQPNRQSATYGLREIPASWLQAVAPAVPNGYRQKLYNALPAIRSGQQRRAAIDERRASINRMNEAFAALARQISAEAQIDSSQVSDLPSSNYNSVDAYQMEQYLRGKANRAPCSTSNPCGPSNMFRAYD